MHLSELRGIYETQDKDKIEKIILYLESLDDTINDIKLRIEQIENRLNKHKGLFE